MNFKQILEELRLMDAEDEELELGNAYFANTKEDLFNGLEKIIPGDSLAIKIKEPCNDEYCDDHIGEITVEMLDEDEFNIIFDMDDRSTSNDWNGEYTSYYKGLNKSEVINCFNDIFKEFPNLQLINIGESYIYETHPRYNSKYDMTVQEYKEGERINTEEGNGTIEQVGTTGRDNYWYGVRLDNGERIDCYGWELKKLNEDISFANINAEEVYNKIEPEHEGWITFEEIDKFCKFLNISKETPEEELRAIRNTLVKYYSDKAQEYYGDDHGRSRTKEESDAHWKMQDQMSAFTGAIDYLINQKYLNESLKGYELDGKIVHNPEGYNIADKDDNLMLIKNMPSLKQLLTELAKYL